jgi:dihydroorotase
MTLVTTNKDGTLSFPGLIDCHVHFREPGLEHKATMKTEAASAVAGGVLTVCEMPNTVPPTVTIAALADKVRRADACHPELVEGDTRPAALRRAQSDRPLCDIRFFFGATEITHLQTLRELFTSSSDELKRLRTRCCGLKLYFDHSTGNQGADDEVIEEAFKVCAELRITLVAHCEDAKMNADLRRQMSESKNISDHSRMRPAESEAIAIERGIKLTEKYGTKFHVAHLSTKQGIALVKAAKSKGLMVTCEVTPHHLFLTTDDYKTLGTLAKMNPPLRSADHQAALWKGIEDGTVDCIATDHAPHTLEEKGVVTPSGDEGRQRHGSSPLTMTLTDPLSAPSGVPGVETMLPLLLTVAAGKWPRKQMSDIGHQITFTYEDIARLCFENPNRIFNLKKEAQQIVIDPSAEWTISGKKLKSKCGWTPFEGWKVQGTVAKN